MKKIKIGKLGIGHNHAEGHILGMKHNPAIKRTLEMIRAGNR